MVIEAYRYGEGVMLRILFSTGRLFDSYELSTEEAKQLLTQLQEALNE